MKKSGKRQEEPGSAWMAVATALLQGGVLALAVTLLALFGCAAAVSAGVMGQGTMGRAAIAVCVLGALAGSAVSMRRRRELALPLGLGTGAVQFALLLAAGVLLYEDAPDLGSVPPVLCACLCGGACGGILGRKTKKKRRR